MCAADRPGAPRVKLAKGPAMVDAQPQSVDIDGTRYPVTWLTPRIGLPGVRDGLGGTVAVLLALSA
eukprot:3892332-Rhodomonas_salina.2